MTYTTLITSEDLVKHLDDPDWAIFDCRFDLANTEQGEKEYLESHIPGALYVHLDQDLSAPAKQKLSNRYSGRYSGHAERTDKPTGRHPWLSVKQATYLLSDLGIDENVQVVVYDAKSGALAAARLWWTLRWLGHDAVAVLDGGWQNWVDTNSPISHERELREPRKFKPHERPELILNSDDVERIRLDKHYKLIDARGRERYLGLIEPIDPIAGHIPGAINIPFANNLDEKGFFLPRSYLKKMYRKELGRTPMDRCVFYCGSGVTSIHNLIALMHIGMGEGRLYAGSWSDWISNEERPVATDES
jgi:thiosulfate/3-mercaptopyruvate sulfurtransferase